MTKLLIRLFIKNADQTEEPAVRSRYGAVAGIVGIFCKLSAAACPFGRMP